MLITCPECSNNVSDKAISCPLCGYPIKLSIKPEKPVSEPVTKPRKSKKKHKKLPNGFGSIKKLSGNRANPYAAYPPTKEFNLNGSPVSQPAIGYFPDWYAAFDALREYNHNPYDIKTSSLTFANVYEMYFNDKYIKDQKRKFSQASINSTKAAYKNAESLHNKIFKDIRKSDMQRVIDECTLKHSSLELIVTLFKQMYKYAIQNDITDKDYAQFVTINIPDDDEKGEPFSQQELNLLWENSADESVQMILIMIYSGYRIKAFETLEINLDEQYFQGGVKTTAGKNRIVPIHDAIYGFAKNIAEKKFDEKHWRKYSFYPALEKLGISVSETGKKHTPHNCRHTFSWLCDKYGVDGLSKHMLMGHSLGNDVEQAVYGHRTLEQLRQEIGKIQIEKK